MPPKPVPAGNRSKIPLQDLILTRLKIRYVVALVRLAEWAGKAKLAASAEAGRISGDILKQFADHEAGPEAARREVRERQTVDH